MTVGTTEDTYAFNGRSGDMDLLLWPVHFTLAYVGFSVLKPFVAYGVEAGLRYSEASVAEAGLKRIENQLAGTLTHLDEIETIPFNRRADCGSDGRITRNAPVFSPFIRQEQHLILE